MTRSAGGVIVRDIEPALDQSGDWVRVVLPMTLCRFRGGDVSYRGHVLKPRADTGSRLPFVFRTSALRRAHLRVPICVDVETVVRVFIDGALTRTATLRPVADGRPTLRILAQDITRWTERADTTRLQLQFASNSPSNSLAILLSEDQLSCRATVLQRRGRRYAITSGLYFLLAWATLLSAAVVALASLPLQETLRAYAVVVTALLWIGGLLGLPTLAGLPVRSYIRRIFAATHPVPSALLKRRRELAVATLVVAFVASGLALTEVVSDIRARQEYRDIQERYTELINAGWHEPSTSIVAKPVLDALLLVPWRREAQVLVERAANTLRKSPADKEAFRKVAQELATDEIEAAIRVSGTADLPSFLQYHLASVQNPLVWYATFIIEGERDDETKLLERAIFLLSPAATRDPEAALLLDVLALKLANDRLLNSGKLPSDEDFRELDRLARDLEQRVTVTPKDYFGTHTYLWACEMVAMSYVSRCDKDPATNKWVRTEKEAAKKWLRQMLMQRAEPTGALWLRPPGKFVTYHMFGLFELMTGYVADGGVQTARGFAKSCPDFEPEFRSIAAGASQFSSREGWLKGTVFERDDPWADLDRTLTLGWR